MMPVGDCQRAFAESATKDGIVLSRQSFDWLCEQGHFGLERVARGTGDAALVERGRAAVRVLAMIYDRLGGDPDVLRAGRPTKLPGDFVHEQSRTLIEVDESQHFTSFRLAALELYPEDVELGFSLDDYKRLCREWRRKSDGFRRTKEARGFGIGARQRQRAYYDALRDLAAPAMGHPPLVRIAALDGNGAAAFRRNRSVLSRLLTIGPTEETQDPAEGSTGSHERSSSPVDAVDLDAAVESSPATIVGVGDRPTLHDEIADILRADGPLTTREIAERVNARGRYTKRDRSAVTDYQVHGRTKNYGACAVSGGDVNARRQPDPA